jgi:hypothetical protein
VRRLVEGRSPRRRRTPAALALLALLAAPGCAAEAMQFRNDHRLTFQAPAARHRVTAPLTVRWSMRGFDPVGLDGSRDRRRGVFAVFVDSAPMPVGKDLRWIGRKDTSCRRDPRCPDSKYLEDHGVLVTTDTSVTLAVLPSSPAGRGDEQHFVNVVLLDGTGHRIGESAWYRPFTSKRRSST